MVTKVIGNKLMKGYSLSQVQCKTCEMPIMERKGLFHCVACPYIKKKAKKNACLKRFKVQEMMTENGKDLNFLEQLRDQSQTPRISNRNSKQEFPESLRSPSSQNIVVNSSKWGDFNAEESATSDDQIDDILESEAQKVLDLMVSEEPMVLIYDTIAEESESSSNDDSENISEGLDQHEMKEEVRSLYSHQSNINSIDRCLNLRHNERKYEFQNEYSPISTDNISGQTSSESKHLERRRDIDSTIIDEVLNEFEENYEEEKTNESGTSYLHQNCQDSCYSNLSIEVPLGCCTDSKEISDHYKNNIPENELSWAQENDFLCSIEEGAREDSWSNNVVNSFPLYHDERQCFDNDFPDRQERAINAKMKKSALLQILSNEPDSTYIYVEESSSEESDAQPKCSQPKKDEEKFETCEKIHHIKNRDWNSENFSNYIFNRLKVEGSSSGESDAQPKCSQPKKVEEKFETCKKIHPIKNRDWNSENFSNHIFNKLKDGWILTPFRCSSCVALQMKPMHGETSCIFCNPCDPQRQMENEFDDQFQSKYKLNKSDQSVEDACVNQGRKIQITPSGKEFTSESHDLVLDKDNQFFDEISKSASKSSSTEKTELTSTSSFMTQETLQVSSQKELQNENSSGKKYKTESKIDEVWKELLAFEKEMSEKHLLPSTSFGSEDNFGTIVTSQTDDLVTGSLTQSIHELSEERNLFDKTISTFTFEWLGNEERKETKPTHHKIETTNGIAHEEGLRSTINDIIEKQKEIDKQFIDIIPNALNFCLSPINQCNNCDENGIDPTYTANRNRSLSSHENNDVRNISILDKEDDTNIDTQENKNELSGHINEKKHSGKDFTNVFQMMSHPTKPVHREEFREGKENIFSQNGVNRTLQKWQEYENGRLKAKIKDNGKSNRTPENDTFKKKNLPTDSTKELRKASLCEQEILNYSKADPHSSQKNPISMKKNTEPINFESHMKNNQSNYRKSLLRDDDVDDVSSLDDSWSNNDDEEPEFKHEILKPCDKKNNQARPKSKPMPESTMNPKQKIKDVNIHQTRSLDDKTADNYIPSPDSSFDAKLLYDDDDDYSNTLDDDNDDGASFSKLGQDSGFIENDDSNGDRMRNSSFHRKSFTPNSTKESSNVSPMSVEKSSQSDGIVVDDEYNIEAQIEMALLLQQLASAASARKSKRDGCDSALKSRDESLTYLKYGLF